MYKITISNLQKQSKIKPEVLYTNSFLKVAYVHLKTVVAFHKSHRKAGKIVLNTAYMNETPDASNRLILGILIQGETYDIVEIKFEVDDQVSDRPLSYS